METGECPDLFVACSDQTSPVNTICVRPAEKPALCPITDIRVIEKAKVAEFIRLSNNGGSIDYEEVPLPADFG